LSGAICVFVEWDDSRREFVRKLDSLGLSLLILVITEPGGKDRISLGVPQSPHKPGLATAPNSAVRSVPPQGAAGHGLDGNSQKVEVLHDVHVIETDKIAAELARL
jgi:hypothetical protein